MFAWQFKAFKRIEGHYLSIQYWYAVTNEILCHVFEILRNPSLYLSSSPFISAFHMYTAHASISTMPATKFLSVSTTTRILAHFDFHNETYKCTCAFDSDWNFRWIFSLSLAFSLFCRLDFGRDFHSPIRIVVHSDDSPCGEPSVKGKTNGTICANFFQHY